MLHKWLGINQKLQMAVFAYKMPSFPAPLKKITENIISICYLIIEVLFS